MISIAICDDDKLYIEKTLKPLLSRAQKIAGAMTEIKFFTDGNILLDQYKNHQSYDIVILDIDMPSINGKDLATILREFDNNLYIAFFSSYKEEVYDVIALNICAFIPKEYDNARCLNALVKLLKKYMAEKPEQTLFSVLINGKSALIRINIDNIVFIKSIKGIVSINTTDNELISTERSLKKLEAELSIYGFYKLCNNILVNVNKVYEVLDKEVILNDNTHLPISRRRRKGLLIQLSKIISAKVAT